MKILFLSRWLPLPADNGSKIRIFNLLQSIGRQHEIHLVSFSAGDVRPEIIQSLERIVKSVTVVPYRGYNPRSLKALAGFFSLEPRSQVDSFSQSFMVEVKKLARQHHFDLVVASQLDMAPYASFIHGVPRLLEELEIATIKNAVENQPNLLKRWRHTLTWWKLKLYIRRMMLGYSGVTVVSDPERDLVQQLAPDYSCVSLIPNGVDVAQYEGRFGKPEPNTLIYSGSLTYQANFDAVQYFLTEIFPLVLEKNPAVHVYITGDVTGVALDRLPKFEQVVFTGYLPDVRPSIQNSWISIVPLRVGGGTRLKILEALALGTPVVSTQKGAEGLDLTPGHDLLIADQPQDFADSILRLLDDEQLHRQLSTQGKAAVSRRYDWKMIGQKFEYVMESCFRSATCG